MKQSQMMQQLQQLHVIFSALTLFALRLHEGHSADSGPQKVPLQNPL